MKEYDVVEAFSARLRSEVDLDALATELLTAVDQAMQPTRTSLWLRPFATSPSGSTTQRALQERPPAQPGAWDG